jgi:hypothetical protein
MTDGVSDLKPFTIEMPVEMIEWLKSEKKRLYVRPG